jgi:glycosyltransferase involved in cell wall biosynthesis
MDKHLRIAFSFIVPTRGEQNKIERCVDSIIQAINLNSFKYGIEILIINTGEPEALKYPNNNLSNALVKTISNKNKNVCRARNIGIRQSRGEYVILIDDDAFIDKNFFINLNKYIFQKRLKCICGRMINPINMGTITEIENKTRFKYLKKHDFNLFRGTCIIIKKSVIESVGNYDENYGPGGKYFSAEESDLFFRLKRKGIEILFVHDVIFYHPIEDCISRAKIHRYSYAIGKLLLNRTKADKLHAPLYLYWLIRIIIICNIRLIQLILWPRRIEPRDNKNHYLYVLKGLSRAISEVFRLNPASLPNNKSIPNIEQGI